MFDQVIVTGCFDILHQGHVEFLGQARKLGYVTVVIPSDEVYKEYKREQPALCDYERKKVLSALKTVDSVVITQRTDCVTHFLDGMYARGGGYDRGRDEVRPVALVVSQDDPLLNLKAQECEKHKIVLVVQNTLKVNDSSVIKARLHSNAAMEKVNARGSSQS